MGRRAWHSTLVHFHNGSACLHFCTPTILYHFPFHLSCITERRTVKKVISSKSFFRFSHQLQTRYPFKVHSNSCCSQHTLVTPPPPPPAKASRCWQEKKKKTKGLCKGMSTEDVLQWTLPTLDVFQLPFIIASPGQYQNEHGASTSN